MHPLLKTRGYKPRTGTVAKCTFCNVEFYLSPFRKAHYKEPFCCHGHQILKMKQEAFYFNCKNCGKKVLTQPTQIKYRNRNSCSLVCREALRKIKTLEKRKTYTKHQLDRLARYSEETKIWRKAIFERDNYTCQICGIRGTYLEADHIKPFAYFPELRYDLNNGRTLCKSCHNTTKISYKVMRKLYMNLNPG